MMFENEPSEAGAMAVAGEQAAPIPAERETVDAQHDHITELSRQGYQHLKGNQLSEAISCFREILEENGDNNYALVGIGDAYRKKKRFQEAAQYYQRCLALFPKNNYALFGLADCYRNLKQFHRAIEVWEEYLTLDDRNVTVLTRVADAYRKVRNLGRSREIYLQVLEMEENNAYALIGLGHLFYDFKEYPNALRYWQRMYDIQGEQVDIRVLTSLGNCHRKMKTYAEGIVFFQKALEMDCANFYALFGLADCYRGMNLQEQCLVFWNRILDQDPYNKVILTRAGDAYRRLNQWDKARDYYNRALNIEYDTYAILGLAQINKLEGRLREASESMEGLLRHDPRLHRLYPELLECYIAMNDQPAVHEIVGRFSRQRIIMPCIVESFETIRRQARV